MNVLQEFRKRGNFTLEELSAVTYIDKSLLSKYESGKRLPSTKHIDILSRNLCEGSSELSQFFQAEKIAYMLRYEPMASEILAMAELRIEYLTEASPAIKMPSLSPQVVKQLEQLDRLKMLWQKKRPLKGTQLLKLHNFFNTRYTFDSNRIEGNTLTHQETSLVINEGITIGGKSLREHLEAINHSDAVHFIGDLVRGKEEFTKRTLLEIHALILKSIDQENAGRYRQVPVRISGSKHEPPQPYLIDKLMEDYFDYYRYHKNKLHPVILAAEMHERLVSIHPFIDGNGRASRLVMNFILLKHGYTVTSLKGDDSSRLAYYVALEKVQMDNDPASFYELILERLSDSLQEHLKMI